eukprot:Tbor_TRINITY_DN1125_c0_g2::TRINITY_DN1125_c0_g2_i1::g.15542::m.15542
MPAEENERGTFQQVTPTENSSPTHFSRWGNGNKARNAFNGGPWVTPSIRENNVENQCNASVSSLKKHTLSISKDQQNGIGSSSKLVSPVSSSVIGPQPFQVNTASCNPTKVSLSIRAPDSTNSCNCDFSMFDDIDGRLAPSNSAHPTHFWGKQEVNSQKYSSSSLPQDRDDIKCNNEEGRDDGKLERRFFHGINTGSSDNGEYDSDSNEYEFDEIEEVTEQFADQPLLFHNSTPELLMCSPVDDIFIAASSSPVNITPNTGAGSPYKYVSYHKRRDTISQSPCAIQEKPSTSMRLSAGFPAAGCALSASCGADFDQLLCIGNIPLAVLEETHTCRSPPRDIGFQRHNTLRASKMNWKRRLQKHIEARKDERREYDEDGNDDECLISSSVSSISEWSDDSLLS